jgi:hypothetical protein
MKNAIDNSTVINTQGIDTVDEIALVLVGIYLNHSKPTRRQTNEEIDFQVGKIFVLSGPIISR